MTSFVNVISLHFASLIFFSRYKKSSQRNIALSGNFNLQHNNMNFYSPRILRRQQLSREIDHDHVREIAVINR